MGGANRRGNRRAAVDDIDGVSGCESLYSTRDWNGLEELERRLLLSGSLGTDISELSPLDLDQRDPLRTLGTLYDEYLSFQQNTTSVPPGEVPAVFSVDDPLMQVVGGYVAVEAVGYDTTDALLNELQRLGLEDAVQVNYVVAGQLPILSIVELPLLDELRYARADAPAGTRTGLVAGQGDGPLESDDARNLVFLDGTGVTIGVISDSYDISSSASVNEATDILNGELPNNVKVVLEGAATDIDEGRAMAQIIHDIAPGADIGFHAAGSTEASFITAVNQLASGAAMNPLNAADIIVDDIFIREEAMLRDSQLSQAVDAYVAGGGAYFSAAGNDADLSYEAAFDLDGTSYLAPAGPFLGGFRHDFDPGAGVDFLQQVTIAEDNWLDISFQWDDTWGSYGEASATHDLDIYLYDAAGTTVLASAATTGISPFELLSYNNPLGSGVTTFNIMIVQDTGSATPPASLTNYLKYIAFNGVGTVTIDDFDTKSSTVWGHANADKAYSVGAAAYYDTPYHGVDPAAPESYTSLGSTPILRDTSGVPLASTVYRDNPDAVAPDEVNTSFFGTDTDADTLPNFSGTSAAAPHAAAVAALMLEANAGLTPDQIYTTLNVTARDMEDIGYDSLTGHGLIDAFAAVSAVEGGIFGHAYLDVDGNGIEDTGEIGFDGAIVYADTNSNSQLDQNTTSYHEIITGSTTIADTGTFNSSFSISGVTDPVVDVNVRLDIDHPAIETLVIQLTGPTGQVIDLSFFATFPGAMEYSTTFNDEAELSINARPGTSGVFRPEQALSMYDGLDPNGVWQVDIIDNTVDGSNTTANLYSWKIDLTTGERSTVTDANGDYFLALENGTHTIAIDPGFGFDVTDPVATTHSVTIAGIDAQYGKDFGLEPVAVASGGDMVDILPKIGELIDKVIEKISASTLGGGPVTPLDFLIAAQQIPFVDAKLDELLDFTGTFTDIANRLFDFASLEAEGAPTGGALTADASMLLMIDNANPVLVTVPSGASGGVAGLVVALNAAFVSAGIDPLVQAVANGDNTRIVIEPIIPGIGRTLTVTTLFLEPGTAAVAYGQLTTDLQFDIVRDNGSQTISNTISIDAAPTDADPHTQDNSSIADLVDDINDALAIEGVFDVLAIVDPSDASKLIFAASGSEVTRIELQAVTGNLSELGFATNDEVRSNTNANTGQTELGFHNQQDIGTLKFKGFSEFETELQSVLDSLFTLPPSLTLTYDDVDDILYFTIGLDASFTKSIDLNFNDGIDLGPFGTLEVAADAEASFDAGGTLELEIGVHVGDLISGFTFDSATLLSTLNAGSGTPISVGVTGPNPIASDGKLTGDATMSISLNGASAVAITVLQSDAASNFDEFALAADINDAIAASSLAGQIEAAYDSGTSQMILRVLDPTVYSISLAGGTNHAELGFTVSQTGDFDDLMISVNAGPSFAVNFHGSTTVQDIIDAIETAATGAGESITVTINDDKGFTLTEAGGLNLEVSAAVNFANASPASFNLGIAGTAEDGVLVGQSLHGVNLGDRLFIEEKSTGNNLGLGISVNATADVSAALGLISADLTTSIPLDFGISTGLRLLDPGTSAVDGRIYLEEILDNTLSSLIDVNTISTTAQGEIQLSSAFFSNVDDGSPLVTVGVELTDTSPEDFSSINFYADFNGDKLKGFKDFTIEDIITIVDSVIIQLKSGTALPWLNANMPVLGKSLTEAVDFLDSLRVKFNDLVASIDQTALEDARDGLQTAIDDLGLPVDQRDNLYEALDSLFEALAETDTDRIASRIVAAAAQLTRVIDPIVTAGTVAGNVELGAALDILEPLVPSLNDLAAKLATALGVAELDIAYLDYDNNAGNGVQRTVAIHIGDTIGPLSFVDSPELLTQEFGPLTFDAAADLNFHASGTYDVSFGMNLDAATLADKLFVIVKTPTHPDALTFDPTQVILNAGFAVDATGDIGFGALDLVEAAGGLNLSKALKATASEVSAGQWTFTGTSHKDEFVIVSVNGDVHSDYTVSGNAITFNTTIPITSDTVEVTYLDSAPGDPSIIGNQATLSVDLNDPGFSITGNALGAITLDELVDAIAGNSGPSLQVNTDGLVTGAIDVTALGSTADDAVTLAVSLDHLLSPKLQVNEGALLSMLQNIDLNLKTIVQGIDALLGLLQEGLESEFLSKLPVAGNIDTANTFIGKLRSDFIQPLEDLLCNVGGTLEEVAMAVEQFIFDKLGPTGLNILGDRNGDFAVTLADVDVILTQELFDIRVKLAGEDIVTVDFDAGLDGLPFEVYATGGVEFGWSYEMDLGFGLDKYQGFYFAVNDDATPEITLDLGVGLAVDNSGSSPVPTELGVNLFGLELSATDMVDTNGDTGTFVSGVLDLDLTGAEIIPDAFATSTYGYNVHGIFAGDLFQDFGDVFDASVNLTAQINLLLAAEITSNLPNVSTELYAGWSLTIDTTNGLQTGLPEVEFRDITLDLGDFIGKTIGPVLDKVNEAVEPIKPVIEFLLTEVPGVSQLSELAGKGPVTFLDMAFRQNPAAGAQTKKFVGIVNQILDISAQIAGTSGDDTVALNFGTLSFGSGNGVNLSDPFWNDSSNSNLNSALTTAAGSVPDVDGQMAAAPGNVSKTGAVFETTQRDPDSNGLAGLGLKFDFIQDPSNIFKYLLGQTANIVSWDIPRFDMGFDWEASFRPIPVLPPLKVVVGLGINAFADLSVGFDTRGRETGNFLDGFYFGDLEDVYTGADIDEFGMGIGVRLRAELDLLVASGGIEGEVRADVYANWRDTDDNGKLYIDEIAGIIKRDGIDCLFDIHGEVRAILRVVWEVFGSEGSKDIIDKILFSFENECPHYELGHVIDGSEALSDGNTYNSGTLVIHTGPYASQRRSGSTSDIAEDFTVTQTGPGVFTVAGLGLESVYDGVTSIYFDGGNGNDVFTIVDNVGSPVNTVLLGGAGNDTLNGGEAIDTVDGGSGNDTITTFGGNDDITAGDGNDIIDAGTGNDTIDAGIGNDTIDAGNGNDIVDAGAGIDNVTAGQGNDQVDGGDGADVIYGNAGRDIILAGDGNDEVHAGSGNDQVFGEGGADELYGDTGHDLMYGDNGDTRTAGTPGDDELWGGHDNDLLVGQDGTDILMGGWGHDVILAHLIGDTTATTLDYIEGGPDDDFICGTHGSNTIYGGTADFGLADIIGDPATVIYAGGFSIISCDDEPVPIETDPNEIHGAKFDDQNQNGVWDLGEPGLEGWIIEVHDTVGDLVDTATTDVNGEYWIMDLDPGTYTVSEVLQPGWFQTTPTGDGTYTLSLDDGDIATFIDFGNAEGLENPGSIHGQKWLDSQGVGDRNSMDPGLNGVTIELYDAFGTLVTSQVTMSMDLNGDGMIDDITEMGLYWFEDLAAGDYIVQEAVDPAYIQTSPTMPSSYTVTLAEGEIVTGLDFGNVLVLGQIHGTKWHDLNANGVQDLDSTNGSICEIGLADFTIYLDQNQNGMLDPGETFTTTNANGEYWFMNLVPGTYYVSELLPNEDWEQTYPGGGGLSSFGTILPGAHTINIDYGTVRHNVNFGNRIPGDINGDGFVGIADLNIVLGNWNNDFPLPNCARQTGDLNADGYVGIEDLNVVLGNWNKGQLPQTPGLVGAAAASAGPLGIATDYNGTLYDVDTSGVTLSNPRATGLENIADVAISPIDGTIYAMTTGELLYTLDYVTGASTYVGNLSRPNGGLIFLDGALDFNSAGTLYGISAGFSFGITAELFTINTTTGLANFIGSLGSFQDISAMAYDDAGQLYAVDDVFLYQINPATGGIISQVALSPPPGTAEVVVGMDYDSAMGDLVMGYADTNGSTNWYRIGISTGALTFIGSHNDTISGLEYFQDLTPTTGTITGIKFEDVDGDGTQGPFEPFLSGWTIYLDLNDNGFFDAGENWGFTDDNGAYTIEVEAGSYIVREQMQPDWYQTAPVSGFYSVTVDVGTTTSGIDFGNVYDPPPTTGWIAGTKFNDLNGNGTHDAGEPGLAGWTIYLDLNANGVLDASDLSFVTDVNGNYVFGPLDPGSYLVAEVAQFGWTQTFPDGDGTHTVVVTSDDTIAGIDFGNQLGTGELHGTKWADTNTDGIWDAGEPGWAGVTIYLDLNGNGVFDAGEPTAVTMEDDPNTPADETGMYWFTGLAPGDYVIREVVPDGSQQTYPAGLFVGADIEGTFYDVDTTAPIKSNLQFTSIGSVIGIAQKPGTGLLYAMNTTGELYTFRRADGATNLLGRIGPQGTFYDEGDIDIDPTTGDFYFVTMGGLFKADLLTVANPLGATVTLIGTVPGAVDLSAMAFDTNGDLWVVDEGTETLMQLDKSNGNVLFSSLNILGSTVFDDLASLAFDPLSGDLIFLTPNLFATLDTTTIGANFFPTTLLPVLFPIHSALEYLADGAHNVTLQQGQIISGLDFGNTELIPLPDGDDEIHGIDGDDTIYGDNLILTDPRIVSEGTRHDTIYGMAGADTIFGQEGDDHLWGDAPYATAYIDAIDGGEGVDTVHQTVDSDMVLTDTQLTGQGPDSLIRIERAVLTGGPAANHLNATAFSGPVQLFGLGGADLLEASTTNTNGSQLYGGDDNDTLLGSPGPDLLDGGAGNDDMFAFNGDDTYQFSNDDVVGEIDNIDDTGGTDTLDFSGLPIGEAVSVDMTSTTIATHGNRTVNAAFPIQFENATGGADNDVLQGNANDNVLIGNDGNDTLRGLGGLDTLDGGAGDDGLEGGTDDDLYLFDTAVGSETDTITEDATASGGSDTLDFSTLSVGDDLTVNLSEAASTTFGSHNGRTLVTLAAGDAALIENVTGGSGDDSLTDNQADNTLIGNTGNDVYYFVEPTLAQTDTVSENANEGTDRLDFGAMTTGVQVDLLLATAIGTDDLGFRTINTLAAGMGLNIENLTGGSGNDDLFANNSANVILGGGGIDDLRGRSDDDILTGGAGNDTLDGGMGNDALTGGLGNDQLTAGAGDDSLDGGQGNDTLDAGQGDDSLDGGLGSDTLDGGQDNDTYLFADMPVLGANETDTIVEDAGISGGTDTLDFGTLTQDVTVDLSGVSAFVAQHTAGFVSPIRTINTGDFTLLENAIGGSGDDSFTDNDNSNVFTGGDGSDTFIFTIPISAQTDRVDEQPASPTDIDTLDFGSLNISVTVDLSVDDAIDPIATDGMRTLRTVTAGTAINFENITGGSAGDILTGNSKDNLILGGAGNDAISGLSGNDILDPGLGTNETLSGGSGDDTYLIDDVFNVRTLDFTEDSGTVSGGFASGGGSDTIDFSQVTSGLGTLTFDLNLTTQILNGLTINLFDSTPAANSDHFENVTGSSTINNVLTGNDANNTLLGGSGTDQLDGGIGDDTLFGQAGADTLNGGAGNDLVLGGDGADALTGGNDRDILIGGNQADNLTGDGDDDILIGGSTIYDDLNDPTATNARNSIFAAWLSTFDNYSARINTITNGIGTSSYMLDNTTVLDDGGAVDILTGSASLDWFFVGTGDDDTERDTLNEQAVSI
jgi:Ca2+-binding RTX toxin-like protein/subtilisin-like proprotein convertase family protein